MVLVPRRSLGTRSRETTSPPGDTAMLVGQQLGPFAIEKELGAGAMGAVYLGRYVKTGARVAIKIMIPGSGSQQATDRFEREVAILKQFNHPNIVKIYGLGKSSGTR